MKSYQPYILGHGMAGKAFAKALSILAVQEADLRFESPIFLARGELATLKLKNPDSSLLAITNPSGLHARAILEGERAGFPNIFVEKPACTSLEELRSLAGVRARVAVLHVYREMWGPNYLRELVKSGRLGTIFALESRYWQPTAAHRAVSGEASRSSWKNSPELSGGVDALLDLGSHWIDLISFVSASRPRTLTTRMLYALAEAPHRDTHVQFDMILENGAAVQGSVSKVVHGSGNDLEVVLLGTQGTARWNFMNPDQVILGSGRDASLITRKGGECGSTHAPYHALGWMEGYISIVRKALRGEAEASDADLRLPRLQENLGLLELLISASSKG